MSDIEQQELSKVLKVKDLEYIYIYIYIYMYILYIYIYIFIYLYIYISLPKCQGIDNQSHVSHFAELLLERIAPQP